MLTNPTFYPYSIVFSDDYYDYSDLNDSRFYFINRDSFSDSVGPWTPYRSRYYTPICHTCPQAYTYKYRRYSGNGGCSTNNHYPRTNWGNDYSGSVGYII